MAYVLISGDGMVERRAETAEGALRAYVEFRRAHDHPTIHDGEDQRVTLTGLLATAFGEAGERVSRERLIATLADYVDAAMNPWIGGQRYPSDGYWRFAGASWALDFELPVPKGLLDEVARRHSRARAEELRRGARERLPRHLALPTAWDSRPGAAAPDDRRSRRANAASSSPPPAAPDRPRPGRRP